MYSPYSIDDAFLFKFFKRLWYKGIIGFVVLISQITLRKNLLFYLTVNHSFVVILLGIEANKFNLLSLKKKTVVPGTLACVSSANMKALRLSEIPPTLSPRFYFMVCAGDTPIAKWM